MKFPPDTLDDPQRNAYRKIAGDNNKLAKLEPSDCDCDRDEPEQPNIPIKELGAAATIAVWVVWVLSKGKTPRPPLAPAF